ncbi:MAG: HlyD family secretion protein [Alistipes sp.]|nr:HlyD family secretion protein [Alistipes sp.]
MKQKTQKILYNIVVIILLLCALAWVISRFVHPGAEWTDNAQIKQHIVPVNSRVQGFVQKIYFEEYQHVSKGDTLAIIEDTEFRYRVAQAEADLARATSDKSAMSATIRTTDNNLSVSDAGIEEARVRMENAEREYNRYSKLLSEEAVTRQQYDAVKTNFEALKARYDLLQRQRTSTSLVKQEQNERLDQTKAGIKLAEAALELAKLHLSYTVIIAPCDGITGRKNIQEGQLIQPGQTIVDMVDESEVWVVANYKETQTANIAEGQSVKIEVDALPDEDFKGVVKSISDATGASFSLLPQDNSAGNFVKIEQRIPVRIEFTKENSAEAMARLRAGMNVECEVLH